MSELCLFDQKEYTSAGASSIARGNETMGATGGTGEIAAARAEKAERTVAASVEVSTGLLEAGGWKVDSWVLRETKYSTMWSKPRVVDFNEGGVSLLSVGGSSSSTPSAFVTSKGGRGMILPTTLH
ncbi:hypothetical protein RIF29_19309 [Crotalaria pallida]|uniref:Uncharacterized protein n=1 Tax=Crotalaria pallida TaxID=3830 RepID=A0AAN9F119_CROPI